MGTIFTLQQGDQYAIPFSVVFGGEAVTLDNADGVKIQVGNTLHEYPGGELEYDSDRQVWLFPITQELTNSWLPAKQPYQVSVLRNEEVHLSPTGYLQVGLSIIKGVWTIDAE